MIVLNKQANQNVKEATVRNFYPRNPVKIAAHAVTQSQDNFFSNHNHHYNNQQNARQAMTPNNGGVRRYDEYTSAYGSPKYHTGHSQSQQIFTNTAPTFFQPQKSIVYTQQDQTKPQQIINQAHTQMNGKTYTDQMNKEKLIDARKNRQQTELNVNTLKNRIHLLELKEKQTMTKMIDTQKKTIDIIMNKTNHQQKLKNKNESLLQKQEDMIRRQLEVKETRDLKKLKEQMVKQSRVQSAQQQAKRIKDLKELYSTHQQFMQEEMWLRNAQSYETIKFQEKEQELKRQQLNDTKKSIAYETYKNKCKTELTKKAQNEFQYIELERKEQELLKKLQASQNLQSVAIQELQKARFSSQSISHTSSTVLKNDTRNYYMA